MSRSKGSNLKGSPISNGILGTSSSPSSCSKDNNPLSNFVSSLQAPVLLLDEKGMVLNASEPAFRILEEKLDAKPGVSPAFCDLLEKASSSQVKDLLGLDQGFSVEALWKGGVRDSKVSLQFAPSKPFWLVSWRQRKMENGQNAPVVSEVPYDWRERFEKCGPLIALGQMAGSIAHEINNPLTILLWQSERLKAQTDPDLTDPHTIKQISDQVERTVIRISRVVKTLKTSLFGQENHPLEVVDLAKLSEEIHELCHGRLSIAGVEWRNGLTREPLLVLAQPTALSQVFLNLMSNSCDALQDLDGERWIDLNYSRKKIGSKSFLPIAARDFPLR